MSLPTVTEAAIDAGLSGARDRRNAKALGEALQAAAVADLNQDISATYEETEVQAISDKVDALLAALRASGLLAAS